MSISRSALLAAAGIVGGGAVAGVTYAAVATPATASSAPGTTVSSTAATPAPATAGVGGRLRGRALLNRLEHGELTLRTKNGDKTVDLQRGTVSAVSPTSITVQSADKVTQTYTVTSATRVRSGKARGAIGDVHTGDTVFVVASAGDALRILDRS